MKHKRTVELYHRVYLPRPDSDKIVAYGQKNSIQLGKWITKLALEKIAATEKK